MDLSARIFNRLFWFTNGVVAASCSTFVYIYCKLYAVKLGKGCRFFGLPAFYRNKNSSIIIGRNCQFRSRAASNLYGINHKCIISTHSEAAIIEIGENSGFSGTTIGAANFIKIGNNVLIGANSVITDFDWHSMDPYNRIRGHIKSASVTIEDNVWVGAGSTILKGVCIGKNTIIGAGSVVTSNMPANAICAGNPCRVIKLLNAH